MAVDPATTVPGGQPTAPNGSPSEPADPSSPDRRRGLLIAVGVFTSGAVLLGVEIAASRVLAPFFGSSLFVWGALIGVVLTGLMLGYSLGGRLADRVPTPALLVGTIGLGSLLVLLIPLLDGPILEFVVGWDPGPRMNPLVASVLLFGPMSVVLAATTPIAVRLSARSIAHLGRTSGSLFSISTAGSIIGTFLTAFFLIPELGTNQLLAVAATVLALVALAIAAVERVWPVAVAVAAIAVGGVVASVALAPGGTERLGEVESADWSPVTRARSDAGAPRAEAGSDVVYAKDTQYHRISVTDDGTTRYLRFDNSWQSAMRIDDPYATVFDYTDYMQLAMAYAPQARRVLFIGLGGGTVPKRMLRDFPQITGHAVEIDPEVVTVARRYFELPETPRLTVSAEDGRRYLTRTSEKWDAIIIDAFFADAIPFHLATSEFLDVTRDRLAPGGVVVTNIIGALDGDRSELFRSMYRTYRTAFEAVSVHPVGRGAVADYRNIIVVAGAEQAPARSTIERRWEEVREREPRAVELQGAIRDRYERQIAVDDVPTLTDDYAPTDHLLLLE